MSRESIYAEFTRPGWEHIALNAYAYTRDGVRVATVHATHKRAYVNGVKYQSFAEAMKAVEAMEVPR